MSIDYVRIENMLEGNIPIDGISPEENQVLEEERQAFEIGRLADRFAQGYYGHSAAIKIARNPISKALLTTIEPGQCVPTETVVRKDGTKHVFSSHYYLEQLNTSEMADVLDKVWLAGSLLSLGDALSKHDRFRHVPELEMVYHLRNGIAHGNLFNFKPSGLARLAAHPAHNRTARIRAPGVELEITPALHGRQVLFDFMCPGDVLDLLISVSIYLRQISARVVQ